MEKTMKIDFELAVLGSIDRLRKKHGSFTGPTLQDIQNDLKKRYGKEFSDRWILEQISKLESKGLVMRKQRILRDGRMTVFTTTKGEEVALTLIKLSDEEAFIHNGWEGLVYDPKPYNINNAAPSINPKLIPILMGLPAALCLILRWLQRLPKPTASWSCINCGNQIQSHQFNEVVICPICGQAHFLTLDKIWRFPFNNKDEYIIPKLDFLYDSPCAQRF